MGLSNRMVPAHRQETPGDAAAHTGGFAKVLTSIQGLQQRLDGFSADEADQAEANVHTLIARLTLLQSKLDRVEKLKRCVSTSSTLIGQIPEQNFDRVDLDNFENHPQLRAIIQASKLIQIHRLMKSAKADAESLAFDSELGQLQFPTLPRAEKITGVLAPASDVEPTLEAGGEITASAETEAPDKTAANTIREDGWVFSADAELDKAEPQFVETAIPPLHGIQHQSDQKTLPTAAHVLGETQKQSVAAASFDQRFLRDLIETYGELSPASQSIALIQPPPVKLTAADAEKDSPPSLSTFNELEKRSELYLVPQNPEKHSMLPVQVTASNLNTLTLPALPEINLPAAPAQSAGSLVQVANIAPLPKPDLDQGQARREKANVPNVTNNGELDQQLKRIIKDYGEYDLYSQQSSMNLKKAAIAAFALLGLVLGGLYFFKATAPALNSPARSVAPSSPTLNPNHGEGDYHRETGAKSQGESKQP